MASTELFGTTILLHLKSKILNKKCFSFIFYIWRLLQWRLAAADLCSIGVMAPKSVILTKTGNSITLRRVAAPGDIFVPDAGEGDAVVAALAGLLARPGEVAARVVACLEAAVVTLDGRKWG